jgi:hypothetical protein
MTDSLIILGLCAAVLIVCVPAYLKKRRGE